MTSLDGIKQTNVSGDPRKDIREKYKKRGIYKEDKLLCDKHTVHTWLARIKYHFHAKISLEYQQKQSFKLDVNDCPMHLKVSKTNSCIEACIFYIFVVCSYNNLYLLQFFF